MPIDIATQLEEMLAEEPDERRRVIGEAIDWIRNMRRENGYLRRSIEELLLRGEEKGDQ